MNYLGLGVVGRAGARLVSSCKDLYNDLNGANLTGAIDVVVVKQTDGTFKSTPFHVRFGKWGVLRTGDLQKEVEVEVNGEPVHNKMMLDESGSVFFIKPKDSMSFDVGDESISEDVFHPRSHSLSSVPDPIHSFYDRDSEIEELQILESISQTESPSDLEKDDKMITIEDSKPNANDPFRRTSSSIHVDINEDPLAVGNSIASNKPVNRTDTGSFLNEATVHRNEDIRNENISASGCISALSDQSTDSVISASGDVCEDRASVVTLKDVTSDICDEGDGVICDSIDSIPREDGDTCIKSRDIIDDDQITLTIDSSSIMDFSKLPLHRIDEQCSSTQPENLHWLLDTDIVQGNDNKLCTELDSGVLSDSAIELHRRRYFPVKGTLSDSEIEDRMGTRTEGQVSAHTVTKDHTHRGSQLPQDVSGNSLWGTIRGIWSNRKRRRFSSIEEGVYLDDLDSDTMGDKEKAEYLLPTSTQLHNSIEDDVPSDSSGVDTLSPHSSPTRHRTSDSDSMDRIIDMLSDISVSQCGLSDDITEQSFASSQISFSEFCANPEILANSSTILRINGRYYSWSVAGPMIMSAILYQQPLPGKCQEELEKRNILKDKSSRWHLWSQDETAIEKFGKLDNEPRPSSDPHRVQSLPPRLLNEDPLSSDEEEMINDRSMSRVRQRSLRRKRFIFTNELSSQELARWPLKPGKNDLVFSITTKYQGTAKATCTLYLWNYDDKIVVSDFDGTITRSDVAGQVLPFLGKDWTHFGVIELFSAIHDNGYKFLYLSARAIGQSMYTKNYLRSTRSRNCYLPDGPLLVTPFSLYKAFKKEVIERKPEEFKILSLQQIRMFFPDDYNPFHAGFGNKPSDAKSYLEVDIPSSKIYTVNPKGEVKNELTWTFQSSYTGLMELMDGVFPPLTNAVTSSVIENVSCSEDSSTVSEVVDNADTHNHQTSLFPDDNYDSFLYWQRSLTSFDKFDLP